MSNNDDLPKRENKEQRKADQARAARIERESFSVPDRFAERRNDNSDAGYNYDR